MTKQVDLISESEVFNQAIFRILRARLRFERYDGAMSGEIVRLVLDRGDSVAALIHDRDDDLLIMTEQFRYPTFRKGSGWLVELPAGMVKDGENPDKTMIRELREEIGYQVTSLRHISTFFVSPGGTSERIHLYYASVSGAARQGEGGGLDSEGEDIRVVRYPIGRALEDAATGRVEDAKTLIALQWLALNRDSL